ncbi:MarR family transcriptional regulator [Nocardiopsis alba]|uniref:MarR family transcriptional regulator n=1 Tax=Nocardiopsis alba TaxID=53437 RepID=A0ABV5DUK6_9ACTN
MSTPDEENVEHESLERARARVSEAGRHQSNAAVMFHTALGDRLGIGVTDWKILGLLEENGPLTAGELVRLCGLAPASVTGVADRLERRGYVRRRKDERDGRRVLVELGPDLPGDVQRLFAGFLRRLDGLLERYDARELEAFADLLEEVARIQTESAAELTEEGEQGAGARR